LKIDYTLGHKANTNKNIKIIPCISTNHNGIKLEICGKENCKSHSKSWPMNNTFSMGH
jgi:hypothetical protein